MTAAVEPLAVAVVSFNTRPLLERCLQSVIAAEAQEVVVVDNGSADGSAELVRTRFPSVRLLENAANRGYGAAANQAIAACTAPAVLLLNSDTEIDAGALPALGRYLAAHPRAAVVGPRLAYPDGRLQHSTYPFPSAADTFLGESGLHRLLRAVPGLRELSLRTWNHDRPRRVPWALGAALAIRRTAWAAAGGFDEDYFMYGEEVDLCRRLAALGLDTHYAPVTTVIHLGGASTRLHAAAMRREFVVSKRRYVTRHESERAAIRLLAVIRIIVAARFVRDIVRLGLARDGERRRGLRVSASGWRSILAEKALWRP